VIRARRVLVDLKYLKVDLDTKDLRKIRLTSNAEPFVKYAESRLCEGRPLRGKQTLSDDERTVLLKILDSDSFRKSLDDDLTFRIPGVGGFQHVAGFVEMICTVSHSLRKHFSSIQPDVNDVLQSQSFDDFVKVWSVNRLERDPVISSALPMIGKELWKISRGIERIERFANNILRDAPFFVLCIPPDLAWKLIAIGRAPMTLHRYFEEALEHVLPQFRRQAEE
jgi:hypothetical protein